MSKDKGLPARSGSARVLIVDDHPIVRQGLAQVLEQESDLVVCGEADTAEEALDAIAAKKPDVVIVDLLLKDGNGLDLIKTLRSIRPDLPILVLSMHDESLYAERALRAGAQGYIMKEQAADEMLTAVRKVLAGDVYLSQAMVSRILRRLARGRGEEQESPLQRLTDRELEVFRLIGEGLGTRRIAARLGVSVKTIESYRANIKEKLQLASGSELVRHAVQWVEGGEL